MEYELFAVAVHLGKSIFSGHYISYGKRNGEVNEYFYLFKLNLFTLILISGFRLMIQVLIVHRLMMLFQEMPICYSIGEFDLKEIALILVL